MSVTVAKSAGFCFGVNRAVDLVEKTAMERNAVATLGPIIHNRHVVNGEVVKDPSFVVNAEVALEGRVVIIRRGKKKFYMGELV